MNIQDYKNRKYKDRRTGVVYTVYKVDGNTNLLHLISSSGNTTTQELSTDMIYNWERIH